MTLPKTGGRHWNFYIALASGAVAAAITLIWWPEFFPAVAAAVFSLVYLLFTARDMPRLTPDYLRKHASDEDAPPFIVFLLTLGIVAYVTVALFIVANSGERRPLLIATGAASLVLSWLMIHVMWGMHYAWEYYEKPQDKRPEAQPSGGLKFPGNEAPDGMAFVYFSLVIAMTAQTSDTEVTSNKMRRIVTGHSLFSYLFNTVAIAAAVNIVVSLGQ